MTYKMRRADRAMAAEKAHALLKRAEYGILSIIDTHGLPYGIPLSFSVMDDSYIVFHGAKEGRKVDGIENNDRACFTVVGETEVLPSAFSTNYESVIAEGAVAILEGDEKIAALRTLIDKYSKGFEEPGMAYILKDHGKTMVYALKIEAISGKSRQ